MPADDNPRIDSAVAGFQAGMFALPVFLLALGLASAWYRRTFWYVPNLMASTFYGEDAIRAGLSWWTVSGIALYTVIYSLFGALFGLAMQDRFPRLRLVLLGMLCGIGWYYLWFGLLWKWLNPLVTLYTHDRPMLWCHLLYGALLGRYPMYLERLRKRPPDPRPLAAGTEDSGGAG